MDARSQNWAQDALLSMFEARERIGAVQVESNDVWEALGPRVVSRLSKDLVQMDNALLVADALDAMVNGARAKGFEKVAKALVQEVKQPLAEKSKGLAEAQSREWNMLLPLLDTL